MEYDAALRDREQALNGPVPILKRKTRAPIYKQKSSIMSFIYFSKTHICVFPLLIRKSLDGKLPTFFRGRAGQSGRNTSRTFDVYYID